MEERKVLSLRISEELHECIYNLMEVSPDLSFNGYINNKLILFCLDEIHDCLIKILENLDPDQYEDIRYYEKEINDLLSFITVTVQDEGLGYNETEVLFKMIYRRYRSIENRYIPKSDSVN